MKTPHPSFQDLLCLVFPPELLDAFVVTEFTTRTPAREDTEIIEFTFTEINAPPVIPEEHRGKNVVSKGFNRPFTVQDFPLRGRHCLLTIHARRWEIEGVGTLQRTLSFLPESGLKITTDFAAFLKEADRIGAGGGGTDREALPGSPTGTGIQRRPLWLRFLHGPGGAVLPGEPGKENGD